MLVPPSTFHERGEHRFPNVCKTCTASAADRLAVVARNSILSPAHRQTLRIRPPCHLPCLCPVRSLWTKDQIRAGRSVTLAVQRWVLSPEDVTYEPLYLAFLDTFSKCVQPFQRYRFIKWSSDIHAVCLPSFSVQSLPQKCLFISLISFNPIF